MQETKPRKLVGPATGPHHARTGYALAVLAATAWATGGLSAKWLFSPVDATTAGWPFPPLGLEIDPLLLSAARAMLSFVMLLVYLLIRRRGALKIGVRDVPFLALFGVAGLALVHFSYFMTISLTGVATAILLEYLAPIIVLVFSVSFLKERLTWTLPGAVVLSIAGCALMVGVLGESGVAVPAEGLAWGLASAVFFAGYTLMGKYASTRYSSWTLLTYGLGFAALFWVIYLGGPGDVIVLLSDPKGLGAVSFVALVSTIIPFGAFLKALQYIEATKASVTSTLEPVVAGIVAWWILGEVLTPLQLLGGALVIGAIMLAQAPVRQRGVLPPVG
ncbi:MAG: EamA family transporter [Coriobacteriia bacterium]|nr:EamA family transporter [Coriobacteriia bacterium]MBN2823068.1 EamA family transporter [Coriobacteriia bacterium]